MNIRTINTFVAIILLNLACTTKKEEYFSTESIFSTSFNDEKLMDSLKSAVINNHDTISYLKLRDIYILSGHHEEILFFAYIMAYNKQFPAAFFDLYASIPPDTNKRLHCINKYYLLVAYEKKYDGALQLVKEQYVDSNAIPSSVEYLETHINCKEIFPW